MAATEGALLDRIRNRVNDAPMGSEHLLDEAGDAIADLVEALERIGPWVPQVDRVPVTAAHNIADAYRLYAVPAIASAKGEAK